LFPAWSLIIRLRVHCVFYKGIREAGRKSLAQVIEMVLTLNGKEKETKRH
jgi:hypothetical protein